MLFKAVTLETGDCVYYCVDRHCTESYGWTCHRWKDGEQQAVARCTEQRSAGKIRQRQAVEGLRWALWEDTFVGMLMVLPGNGILHNLQATFLH